MIDLVAVEQVLDQTLPETSLSKVKAPSERTYLLHSHKIHMEQLTEKDRILLAQKGCNHHLREEVLTSCQQL